MKNLGLLFTGLFRRSQLENEMTEELRFHIESRADHFIRNGVAADEALRRAKIEFGGLEGHKERCREERGWRPLDELRGDLRYAVRMLGKSPVFAVVAILSLALGIGINLSIFGFVNGLILNPYPYPNLDRIVTVWETSPKVRLQRNTIAPATFFDWQKNSSAFESLAAYSPSNVNLTGAGDPERLERALVTPNFFDVLRTKPALGRAFREDETEPGRDGVVILSHSYWKNRFESSPDVLAKTISLDGRDCVIAGVMPADFDFPLGVDLWTPLSLTPQERMERSKRQYAVIGRLKSGVPLAQARAEMATVESQLAARFPATYEARGTTVVPLRDFTEQTTERFVLVLMVAAIFVLLLACANVANLQLARATARQKEIGLRTALGASRFRIARQLITESLVIGLLAGALGLILSNWDLKASIAAIPEQVFKWVPGLKNVRIDGSVMAFGAALALVAGLICCLPAIIQLLHQKRSTGLNEVLKEGGRASTDGRSRGRLRGVLVMVEVALALVLLVGAGLMVETFRHMLTLQSGIDPKNLLVMDVELPSAKYRATNQVTAFHNQALDGLRAIPGVETAGMMIQGAAPDGMFLEGHSDPRAGDPLPEVRVMSPGYLKAVRIAVLQGRSIGSEDGPDAARVVVLSDAIAKYYWPNSNPIGSQVKLSKAATKWLTVVGVASDTKDGFTGAAEPAVYLPFAQAPRYAMRFYLRTVSDPRQIAGAARLKIRDVDQTQPVFNVKAMEDVVAEQTSGVRASARLMSTYAFIALLLAFAGIYSVSSFMVGQRTHEIGVRMALGAKKRDVLVMTLTQSLRTAGLGLSIGLLLAFLLARFMSHALFNVVNVDPLLFAAFTVVLGCSAAIAGYIPARRAARVDPMVALRHE